MRTALSFTVGLGLSLLASTALAQEGTVQAGGSVDTSAQLPPPPAPAPVQVAQPAPPPPPAPAPAPAVEDDDVSDHDKYAVGHFAVGYMGTASVPLDGLAGNAMPAPTIGARYWINQMIGIDAGLGFGWATGSVEAKNNNATTTTDKASPFGLVIHGGVPIALAAQKHYKFLVIPELNIGFAHMTESAPNTPDISHSGFLLDIGARAGTEVHFGFIGIPQLALQATVGLAFRHTNTGRSQDLPNGTVSASDSTSTISTSVQAAPWALFTNNIAALYYFP